jgi:hypothetical protein
LTVLHEKKKNRGGGEKGRGGELEGEEEGEGE